eukprot:XP_011662462.1 PREDICTED: uncharacterized protein LOC105437502 [Strongylocentrotus purpuratus]
MRTSSERRISGRRTKQFVDNLLQPSTSGESASSPMKDGNKNVDSASNSSIPSPTMPSLLSRRLKSRDMPCSRTTPMAEAIPNSKVQETSSLIPGPGKDGARQSFQNTLDILYPVQSSHDTLEPHQPVTLNKILLSLKQTRTRNASEENDQPASRNKHVRFDGQLQDHNYFKSSKDDHPPLHESPPPSPEHPGMPEDVILNDIPLPTSSLSSPNPPASSSSSPNPSASSPSSPEPPSMPSSPSASQSFSSRSTEITSSETTSDPSYTLSSESSSESDDDKVHRYCSDPKYMVFDSELEKLLYALHCNKCCGGHITELRKNVVGTLLAVSAVCVCGNTVTRWESQPRIGQMPVGNILCTSSAFFSGGTQGSIDFFLSLLNLQNLSKTKFYENQKRLVLSAVNTAYDKNIEQVRRELCGDRGMVICGDGRCDSPGYNAKYCSYTFMHMATSKIIVMSLVQVTEATSSVAMEKLGFKRALDELLQAGCSVATVATDRHTGIRKLVREEYARIDHQFDIWHMTKSVVKKLTAKSKQKENEGLGPWIRAVTNHLWWAATNCKGDEELLVEMWQSITHHVCNVHTWNSGDKYHECAHAPIDLTKERKIKWLTPDSLAHVALQEVLFDKNLVKDIKRLTKACRTGELESFHSMLLKYAPKRQEFDYPVMLARLQLAVLDHNNNVGRDYAMVKKPQPGADNKGEPQVFHSYSKRSKVWTTKDKKVKKKYDYVEDMQVHLLQMQSGMVETEEVPLPNMPQNIAPIPRPPVEELMAKRFRRFKP